MKSNDPMLVVIRHIFYDDRKNIMAIQLIHIPFFPSRRKKLSNLSLKYAVRFDYWGKIKQPFKVPTPLCSVVVKIMCSPRKHVLRSSWESLQLIWKVSGKLRGCRARGCGNPDLGKESHFPGWLRSTKTPAWRLWAARPLYTQCSFMFSDLYLSLGRKNNNKGNRTTGAQLVFECGLAGDYHTCVFPDAKKSFGILCSALFLKCIAPERQGTESGGPLASHPYLNASPYLAKYLRLKIELWERGSKEKRLAKKQEIKWNKKDRRAFCV